MFSLDAAIECASIDAEFECRRCDIAVLRSDRTTQHFVLQVPERLRTSMRRLRRCNVGSGKRSTRHVCVTKACHVPKLKLLLSVCRLLFEKIMPLCVADRERRKSQIRESSTACGCQQIVVE